VAIYVLIQRFQRSRHARDPTAAQPPPCAATGVARRAARDPYVAAAATTIMCCCRSSKEGDARPGQGPPDAREEGDGRGSSGRRLCGGAWAWCSEWCLARACWGSCGGTPLPACMTLSPRGPGSIEKENDKLASGYA
jgi:hypothetical protein